MEKKHSLPLDVLKGLTIAFVVISHSFYFGFENACFSAWRPILLSIDMPIFVLLAGFFSASEIQFTVQGILAYWKKKAIQLLLPLLLLPFLYAMVKGLTWDTLLRDPFHGGYWFTWVLFEMFLLFFLVRLLAQTLPEKFRSYGELAFALISIVFVRELNPHWRLADPDTYAMFSWIKMDYLYHCFVLGYFFRRFPRFGDFFKKDSVWATTALLYFFQMYQLMQGSGFSYNNNESMLASLLGILTAWGIVHRLVIEQNRTNKFLAYLGRESRSLYFVHFFFLFSIPSVGDYLRELHARVDNLFAVEVLFSVLYASWVIALSLIVIRILRKNTWLELLCFGKKNYKTQSYELRK